MGSWEQQAHSGLSPSQFSDGAIGPGLFPEPPKAPSRSPSWGLCLGHPPPPGRGSGCAQAGPRSRDCTCPPVPCAGFARLNPACSRARPAALYPVWLGFGWGRSRGLKAPLSPAPSRSRNPFSGISMRMGHRGLRDPPPPECRWGLHDWHQNPGVEAGLELQVAPTARGEARRPGPRARPPPLSPKTRKEIRCFGKSHVSRPAGVGNIWP